MHSIVTGIAGVALLAALGGCGKKAEDVSSAEATSEAATAVASDDAMASGMAMESGSPTDGPTGTSTDH